MKIAVLLSSYNRAAKTLNCIKTLYNQHPLLDFYLVDDNSSDSTVNDILQNYPDVNIIKGSGDLFWAGAMRYGWSKIDHKQYQALIVVNDDVEFYENAIKNAIGQFNEITDIKKSQDFILVGSTHYFNKNKKVSYGGQKKSSLWHPLKFSLIEPSAEFIEADTLNMNFAIIPTTIIHKHGFLKEYFVHGGADFEFGLRLKKNNVKIYVMKGYIGKCNRNPDSIFSGNILERFRAFNSPKVQPFNQRYRYFRNYGGFFWPILFSLSYIKLFFGLHKNKTNNIEK